MTTPWRRLATAAVGVVATSGLYLHWKGREELLESVFQPWTDLTAQVVFTLLGWSGAEVVRQGTIFSHPGGFSYEIFYGCTALLPCAVLVFTLLARNDPTPSLLRGLALGIPFLLALNLFRLVHLFHVGVNQPAYFPLAHDVLWRMVMVAGVIGAWLLAIRARGEARPSVGGAVDSPSLT